MLGLRHASDGAAARARLVPDLPELHLHRAAATEIGAKNLSLIGTGNLYTSTLFGRCPFYVFAVVSIVLYTYLPSLFDFSGGGVYVPAPDVTGPAVGELLIACWQHTP